MTPAPVNGHTFLDFNAPMTDARAYDLVNGLRPLEGRTVVDFGCGWAELLLRVLETEPTARGFGVDSDELGITRGRANAEKRGLTTARLELADVTTWEAPPADVAISIGASHAWGDTRKTLEAMHSRIKPGGKLLLGDAFWEKPPTDDILTRLDAKPDEFGTLAALVDLAMAAGYRLLSLATANLDEWDSFESRWCAGRERWLLDNPDHPETTEVRAVVDNHRDTWLHGYRGYLGFAYLTLARV
ncbi:class I SAM-dependent methyltransferase [Umezawaea sp. Da 62-37]|uniref:SAM-dependent methyltransferase n=1 Tax=Umezawaea sp. Da 62-37 TaxID=3075927 RepID=UPI0028F6E693|nr:class I SAM-dependent methyltransferase [Umezawaea sp. Da 62-37]WNV84165.1 class I SAM-dependent methyltransferase [Umezawaea sp. Da 62-37]